MGEIGSAADMSATQKQLDGIRAKIAALVDERDEIADAAITRDEAARRFEHLIARVKDDAIMGLGPGSLRDGGTEREFAEWLRRPGFLCEVFGDSIKAALLARFDALVDDAPEGLAVGERRKRLTELDGKLYELERAEEDVIEQLEDQGVDVQRRPDADPRAALGLPDKAA